MSDRGQPARGRAPSTARISIFGTSDLHVHLLPYDYYADRPVPSVGLAQTVALLERLRAGQPNALLFDNGDFLQGTPLSDYIALESGFCRGDLHPVIAAMNEVGYDAATLGNHEFNYGLRFLTDVLSRVGFPVLSANILLRSETDGAPRQLVPPWTILDRTVVLEDGGTAPLRVGVIGFAPPQVALWDRAMLQGRIVTTEIVAAARAHLPDLRAAGADIVVALCHSGIGGAKPMPEMENAALPLAALPGIDALIVGHAHKVFPGPAFRPAPGIDPVAGTLHGKPAVMPGFYGSHLGIIDLTLARTGRGWRVAAHAVRAEPVLRPGRGAAAAPIRPDRRVVETARSAHEGALDFLRRPLGRLTGPVNSFFVLAAPDSGIRIVADAQRRFARRLLADGPLEAAPLIVAVAPFKAGGWAGPDHYVDIPAGPLSLRNAADLYMFPNTLCAVEVTGAQAMDWLERSAGLFRQVVPGRAGQPLIDPDFACYNFDILDGLTYRIDPSRPSRYSAEGELRDPGARRIVEVGIGGRPLDPDERLVIVTNSYRAGGGGMFRAASAGRPVFSTTVAARDVLVDYIRQVGVVEPEVRATWDFVPLPRTGTLFETSPRARRHAPPNFEPLGPTETGFERFAVSF